MDKKRQRYEAKYAEEAALAEAQGLICWVMNEKGISQRELAERLGVSEPAVSKMLSQNPGNLSLGRLARTVRAMDDELRISSTLFEKRPRQEAARDASWSAIALRTDKAATSQFREQVFQFKECFETGNDNQTAERFAPRRRSNGFRPVKEYTDDLEVA